MPEAWTRALPDGGVIGAPVAKRSARDEQLLTRVERRGDEIRRTAHGGVRYVKNRSSLI